MLKVSRFSQPNVSNHSIIHCYQSGLAKIGLVGTWLLNNVVYAFVAMSIFIPKSFKASVEKFSATFGDLDKKHTSTSKL
jgi:hypothetical protein